MTPDERHAALETVATGIRGCQRCRLAGSRTNAVPGDGHPETEVVFVGEGPGQNEDIQGRPFVGAAGGFLDELLGVIGWSRREVFITNVVKCRPPGNRDPEPDEIAACAPWLREQLGVLDPALVVTLGRFSMQTFAPGTRIGQAHGTMRAVDASTGARDALTYAMYHPAAAFRQGGLKETMKLDMLGIPDALMRARELRREHAPVDPTEAAGTTGPRAAAMARDTTSGGGAAAAIRADDEPVERVVQGADDAEDSMEDRDQMGLFG